MILLQLSSGQGPDECARAVALASRTLLKTCKEKAVKADLLETLSGQNKDTFKSVLIELSGDTAAQIANDWQGAMQWICQSPFRPKHKRKNWFFSGQMYEVNEQAFNDEIRFQTCRASGAGGQHVNTTDSAVQATHVASGISVRIETERSQHANKRLAKALIMQKLAAQQSEQMTQQEKERWSQHWELERGNPNKTFRGPKFIL
jgi:peptide chain release factor